MIGALARGVEAILRGRRFPVRVVVGPRLATEAASSFAVQVDLDRAAGDDIGPPVHKGPNPRPVWSRGIGCSALVFGVSSLAGSRPEDHETAANQLVDAFLVALFEWARTAGHDIAIRGCRALTPDERGGGERVRGGEGYAISFLVQRAVVAVDYDGEGELTGSAASVTTESRVSLDGETYEEIG